MYFHSGLMCGLYNANELFTYAGIMKIISKLFRHKNILPKSTNSSYFMELAQAKWSKRDYKQFASEAYVKNVIAHRAINMVSKAAASVPFSLVITKGADQKRLEDHYILDLLARPNPKESGKELLKSMYMYLQIHGNSYMLAGLDKGGNITELYTLRPDRVSVIAQDGFMPECYRYTIGDKYKDYGVDSITGASQILHIKNFNPLHDWYGLSSIEAAAYSIDQHNQAAAWNQALLQNGARPSGAVVVNNRDGNNTLSEEQYCRLKHMIDDKFSGPHNAGKPLLLEGGLEWKDMSLSPKDMDFIESKNSAARDIALAFGVPPQLLGIPGDNTYSNLKEARIALWEQTVIPMVENMVLSLNNWLMHFSTEQFELNYNLDSITALASRRDKIWERANKADFLTTNEKRQMVGLAPLSEAQHDIL